MLKVVLVVLLAAMLAIPAALFFLSAHSTLAFDPTPKAIGAATPFAVRIANPHGVRHVTAAVEQGDQRIVLNQTDSPANRLTFWRSHLAPREFQFTTVKGIKEGKARLVVEAQSNDFRGETDSVATEVQVILRPPSLSVDGFQHYINQGGSEMVILTPSGAWTEAGVQVGQDSFRSFPLGAGKDRIALFAFSWDMPRDTAPFAYVKNSAGAEAKAHFWFKLFPKKFHARNFVIDDAFLQKVVPQVDPDGTGDLLTRFLKVNGEMRRANNQTLADLRFKTAEKFLWSQPFLQMANSKVESSFADVRSYIYKGKKVDQQTHLGFDLAVSQHAPVLAANDGKVVWAAPLGIYGNCIVVDHGYSLQSIYGHLSEIAVKEGQMVKRGEEMGKSGSTGLASGDHLHFSMQIEGVEVNPIEWWDEHWIKDHVFNRLAESGPRP